MNIIQNNNKTYLDSQVSTICIADMPDDKFCVDKKVTSDNWQDFTINSIWLIYFSLILKRII
jgi:hypothetical protein